MIRCPIQTTLFQALALSAIAATASIAQAVDTVRIDGGESSRVWIEGSSNVRDWSCRASTFDARVTLTASTDPAISATSIQGVSVRISARDLKCGNRKMEHDLYAALKATDPAAPSYIVGVFDGINGLRGAVTITTRGTLLVAGVEKPVDLQITTECLADGTVKARGSLPLRMTDFGVTPPTGLFGLIRSKNDVVVRFELLLPAASTRAAKDTT
jgi:polyisoprenoid-binding protein YceI